MNWKRVLVLITALAALSGDALAWSAAAICAASGEAGLAEAACCCGPDACPSHAEAGSGLRAACCTVRQPASSADPAPVPRQVETIPVDFAGCLQASPAVLAPGSPPANRSDFDVPASLHAPPLYTLFRVYRN